MTISSALARRAVLLGWVCGGRTSFGPAALALTSAEPSTGLRRGQPWVAAACAAAEIVIDKLPMTSSRLEPQPLGGRIATGAAVAGGLARRAGEPVWLPVALGAVGAVGGSYAGAAWRRWASVRVPDWQAAIAEDVFTAGLARWATRPLV